MNRALEIGSKLFSLAEEWKRRTGGNPCKFVRKYRETKRERFLTDAGFRRQGEVLDAMEAEGSLPIHPAAATRLRMLIECRRNEIVELAGKNVDLAAGELRLADAKTGARLVPLSPAAARVLAALPRIEGNPWVIPGMKPGKHLAGLNHYWRPGTSPASASSAAPPATVRTACCSRALSECARDRSRLSTGSSATIAPSRRAPTALPPSTCSAARTWTRPFLHR